MWSLPVAVDERIVVSEMGEQWSPKMDPSSTAPMVMITIPTAPTADPSPTATASMITLGSKMPIVAQDEPVANEVPQARKKRTAGNRMGLVCSAREAKYVLVPR